VADKRDGFGCFTLILVALFAYALGESDGHAFCRDNPKNIECVASPTPTPEADRAE